MLRFPSAALHRYMLALVCFALLAAAAGIFRYGRASANVASDAAIPSSADPADAPGDGAQSGSTILLGLARDAMHDGRLVAPAGSNAFEFYLSVLQLEPDNRTANEALRESFPRAAEEIERTINQKGLDEARREIDLLREFDRNNFTLALLGGKLSAARNIERRQHETEAERIRQANAARGAL
ncbi:MULTISPECIES: hypothetical protein [Rhodanobacter]|uniref:hypothetical protein n=1 Tax=Rhodanobacter TaxID=75309 RepID=UPI000488733E|nr:MULTISPECIES: hypothetical protein [Rhodanobacter]TAN14658.1 MAG: energy transducer TonB [Rhodanobacter sp.]UJJ55272.1 energy transducer TonB [Rhodanobacter thiooxydans]